MVHYDNRWPRILFLDAYDSFTNNIVDLIKESINAQVTLVKIDDERYLDNDDAFHQLLSKHDAVVAGPGPGSPTVKKDVGLIAKLWTLDAQNTLPALGICLGFQSLCVSAGASIEKLSSPRHGIVGRVTHSSQSLFRDAGQVRATQYHSLHINTGHGLRVFDGQTLMNQAWSPSKKCPDLRPLAWVFDDVANGAVLMGVEHLSKPFWGLQYHPESICTNDEGKRVIQGWWIEAMSWTHKQNRASLSNKKVRKSSQSSSGSEENSSSSSSSSLKSVDQKKRPAKLEFTLRPVEKTQTPETPPARRDLQRLMSSSNQGEIPLGKVNWTELPCRDLSVLEIQERISAQPTKCETIILESGTKEDGVPVNAETGRFSIMACLDGLQEDRLQYSTSKQELVHLTDGEARTISIPRKRIWKYLKSFMRQKRAVRGASSIPFWGGLVGFVSYEACLESIDVEPLPTPDDQPSLYFVFVTRSIVIDHVRQRMFVQSIRPDDQAWLSKTARLFRADPSSMQECPREIVHNRRGRSNSTVDRQKLLYNLERKVSLNISSIADPHYDDYTSKINACQDALYSGESYELCLTAQTDILMDQKTPDINLYKQLRFRNPAPFSAFLRLETQQHRLSLLGSSPERFMSWDRNGKCQFRPIKGTVKKDPGMTLKRAEKILSSTKERAENLMIVDLIRHDLYGVAGSGNVRVSKLMSVEEYETVFQLVSVVEGEIAPSSTKSGIDILAASLPPGSMTGAPKKRSCEILSSLERRPRGIYSGVLGYLDVGGGGDFSVVIRTAFKWARTRGGRSRESRESGESQRSRQSQQSQASQQSQDLRGEEQLWRIGAGGAITIQSNEEEEWEEMLTKREAIISTFI